ncbi:type I DNA topoisomerase [Pedomonas mirosovicensis]|uniref:type I DNA topoisomerase n=1 Tax=Pedomonas mirosovicensis TaxID=2908641 RepID=UPI002169282D|nr:type I DNA topoisomerase [Pedomonas mirosovicensis]MCH8685630.1 type I DNA topoisomerase [Pedomonas mirosovicensis]
MDVVIVESPAKAKTINKYLGSNYKVLASYGHVRDLPAKDGSVKPAEDFSMLWEVSGDKQKQLKAIADEVKNADRVILATDPDREGEAISWHLLEVLKAKRALPKGGVQRVTFNEITKSAVTQAMANPRDLDRELIDAYLARRALDYLVGFTLSPVLWRKLPGARSAGRVQSVALRLICDREVEIERFVAREYWTVDGLFATQAGDSFSARLVLLDGQKLDKFSITTAEGAEVARRAVESGRFRIASVEQKPVSRNPYPPFITSTLQQEAARKLGFSATQTMRVAQQLYEGISIGGETTGLITYMRTDGVTLSQEAISGARAVIAEDFGQQYLPPSPRAYQTKAKNAQEAHEAIRPTDLHRRPDQVSRYLSAEQAKLYELIWKRTIACQMASARMERTTAELLSEDDRTGLRATGQVVQFPGFLAVYEEGRDETASTSGEDDDNRRLPKLTVGEHPLLKDVKTEQHFTTPPPRYSEASLVKKLEELGIGRPSTYASILQTLRDRAYVKMERNRFMPEDKGRLLTAFLEKFFERYVEYDFTADLEGQLDQISSGQIDWKDVLRAFWADFEPKTKEILELKPSDVIKTLDEFLEPYLFGSTADDKGGERDPRECPVCHAGRLSLKAGKFGAFVGCSNYPECRYTRPFGSEEATAGQADEGPKVLGLDPATGQPVTLRSGRFGPYVQLGEEGEDKAKPPRASIPKDVPVDTLTLVQALALLSLPRTVGTHPETGKPILASIGRFGPYLLHDSKYARLKSTEEVLTMGMNQAVATLADAANRGGRGERKAAAALKELGEHPESGAAVKVMDGRYGPYVTDGKVNATLPKGLSPDDLSLDKAVELLAAKAAKGPAKKPARKAAAPKKATATKKAAAPKKAATAAKGTAKKTPSKAKA